MELPGPWGYIDGDRYIPVEVTAHDDNAPVQFDYVLDPPSELIKAPAESYFNYPVIYYGTPDEPSFDVASTWWTESDGYSSASVNIPWWSGTSTDLKLNEFSMLFTNLAEGFDTVITSVYDPLNYVNFDTDYSVYIEFDITVARKSPPNSADAYSFKRVGGAIDQYGSFDGSITVSDFLVEMHSSDLIWDPSANDVFIPHRGDIITSVEFKFFNDSFATSDTPDNAPASVLDIYFSPFSQRASSINVAQVTTMLANPDAELVVGSGYEAGYIDGKNAGLTEGLGTDSVVDWLVKAGDAVMNFQLFRVGDTSVTIGSIFTVIVGSLLIIFILKVFAGG